jgi:hypothetical protein
MAAWQRGLAYLGETVGGLGRLSDLRFTTTSVGFLSKAYALLSFLILIGRFGTLYAWPVQAS